MSEPSFESRVMNIQCRPASMIIGSVQNHANGHKEARQAAAEIAMEADDRIEALTALVGELVGALVECDAALVGPADQYEYCETAQGYARAALAKVKGVMG